MVQILKVQGQVTARAQVKQSQQRPVSLIQRVQVTQIVKAQGQVIARARVKQSQQRPVSLIPRV